MSTAEVTFYRSLLTADSTLVAVRVMLAQVLLSARQLGDAISEASAALQQDASLVEAWLVRATAQKARCAYADAVADFERAAALAPDRATILINLGNSYAELDRLGDAERWLRRAVALAPGSKEAQANLGSVLVRQGRLADAEAPCRAALAIDPDLVQVHQNMSGILAATDPVAASQHRDAAYGRQQIFIEPAARAEHSVLVLSAASAGNVPLQHLLPQTRTTVIRWYIEYARPGQHAELPPYNLIFNAIGDPDLAPDMPASVVAFLRDADVAVLNRPEHVARTSRSDLPALLAGIAHIVVPAVIRHEGAPHALANQMAACGMVFPVLARCFGAHGGEGLHKIDYAEADKWPPAAGYVTQFVDFISADGWYRKYRMIFVDGRAYPYHLAISRSWLVHYWTAGMEQDAARREEERRFLTDPTGALGETAMVALEEIAQRLGLSFAGIDFSILPDGRIVVFEANATMLVHPEHDACLHYRNPAIVTIQTAFDAMLTACRGAAR